MSLYKISPEIIFAVGAITPVIDLANVVLPQPDSPTIPSSSPSFKFKETS